MNMKKKKKRKKKKKEEKKKKKKQHYGLCVMDRLRTSCEVRAG